ncbi:MAG: TetR/AcrR family transcriptional regulator [Verrucomicrobia bacterium]|jgi:AcrR family transcriptional regulator|nr:TetR/AcrR family transcriptional regulator [Verrucomicrobiota bacterium]
MNGRSFSEHRVRRRPRRQRERQQRRADILAAAERVFAAKGFHAASIEEIARSADYATGTVYLYFKDKETLYIELFEEKIRALGAAIRQHLTPPADPVQALRQVVRARMAYFDQNRPFFSIYAREGMNLFEGRDERWRGVVKLYENYLDLLARLIQSGQRTGVFRRGRPRQFALALSGMMMQITRDWLQSRDRSALRTRSRFVLDLFLLGSQSPARSR